MCYFWSYSIFLLSVPSKKHTKQLQRVRLVVDFRNEYPRTVLPLDKYIYVMQMVTNVAKTHYKKAHEVPLNDKKIMSEV